MHQWQKNGSKCTGNVRFWTFVQSKNARFCIFRKLSDLAVLNRKLIWNEARIAKKFPRCLQALVSLEIIMSGDEQNYAKALI